MKKVLQKVSFGAAGLLLTPALAFAQVQTGGISHLLDQIGGLFNQVVPLLISLAVIAFMWGIVLYLFGKNKDEGKTMMLWGIIAIFIMTSVWGLVRILSTTLGVNGAEKNTAKSLTLPKVTKDSTYVE